MQLLHLYFYVDTTWEVEVHEGVNRLWSWTHDLDQSSMRTHFELLLRWLADKGRPVDTVLFLFGRERYWTYDCRTIALSCVDDGFGRTVDDLVIVRLNLDPDLWCVCFLICHNGS